MQVEIPVSRVNDDIDHATVRDMHLNGAEAGYLNGLVRVHNKGWDVVEENALTFSLGTLGLDPYQPAGVSTRSFVIGSCIGTMPVSSTTVTVQIRLEPDIGG